MTGTEDRPEGAIGPDHDQKTHERARVRVAPRIDGRLSGALDTMQRSTPWQ